MINNLDLGKKIIKDNRVRKLASLIRQKESLAATRFIGLNDSNVHFMGLPFYETGQIKKNKPGSADLKMMCDLIKLIKPHQIFAAGDLADPHGTHKVCIELLFDSLKKLKKLDFMKDCWVWLYRGAWHEWESYEVDMAVPLSPEQVLKKRRAIFYHQSQNNNVNTLTVSEAYKILNLDITKKPTIDSINKAYVKIQKKIHPDVSPETSRLSAIVNEAKEIVLKDIS